MKKFGFGCMRFPMVDGEVDIPQVSQMVDRFLEEGFTYFDTAHGYLNYKSELAVRECLTKRYPRDRYTLTDKLTHPYFECEADIRPFFEKQLERTGVDYFDYYLVHSISKKNYDKYQNCNAFGVVKQLKDEGKIKCMGISFHDSAEFLEKVLTDHPEIEVVQIQFNYVDYDDPNVQSYACYQVCEKFNKPVIVMEPVKGGNLVELPEEGANLLKSLNGGSNASYAIRYAASFPKVFMVLSGMSSIAQMEDNISAMKDFKPFTEEEFAAVEKVREIVKKQDAVACTACSYCTEGCPKQIPIPQLFACYNNQLRYRSFNGATRYKNQTQDKGKASDCVKCGKCENICPQHLSIRSYLEDVAKTFE